MMNCHQYFYLYVLSARDQIVNAAIHPKIFSLNRNIVTLYVEINIVAGADTIQFT